ncbi:MAG: ABC transporter ATP-binding protein, partial [Thermoproteota archaeon]
MSVAIRFENVSKRYKLGVRGGGSLREAASDLFRRMLGRKGDNPADDSKYIWALKDVSFEVEEGEALGIIGPNGAGKTTILKLLSGITKPTRGRIWLKGRVSSLIELGAGFHQDLTGRENIYLNGTILGLKRKEIDEKFRSIVEFSELEKFIDTPIKRYSSGMYVRLGFAVAVHVDPEILLVDEVLAVGDMAFQRKCLNRMREMLRKESTTVVFVSHNLSAVQGLCDRVIWLDKGSIVEEGEPKRVISKYIERMSTSSTNPEENFRDDRIRWGSGGVRITKVRLL